MKKNTSILFGLMTAGLLLVSACSVTSRLDSSDAGRTVMYTPGEPNFDMEAVSTLRDGSSGIDLYLSIPYSSLVYRRDGQSYEADYEVRMEVKDRRGRDVIDHDSWRDSVRTNDFDQTQEFDYVTRMRRVPVDPGEYVFELTLTDLQAEASAVRRQRVSVFDSGSPEPAISRIRVEGRRDNEDFEPVVALHVPANLDSLRAIVELYHVISEDPVNVEMRLLQFLSDDDVASLPHWLSPVTGTLAWRGVNYRRADTLQVSSRDFADLGEEVSIEFAMPPLEQGNYRIEVITTYADVEEENGSAQIREQRDLSIKGTDFPRLSTLSELVDALAYIAYSRELREIRAAETSAEKRQRFDSFWGSLVESRQLAANLMRTYYSRVEEANLLFSTHKEGWKTDRGMVYIIMGPPLYVDRSFDTEIWHYTYSDRDPMKTFAFERVRHQSPDAVFDNYILARRPYYERTWSTAIGRWRSGAAL